jgi:hypothetical protein
VEVQKALDMERVLGWETQVTLGQSFQLPEAQNPKASVFHDVVWWIR